MLLQQDASTFSFEGTTLKGKAAIAGALGKIPIAATEKHRFVTSDLQPSPSAGALLCMVTGDIAVRCQEREREWSGLFMATRPRS